MIKDLSIETLKRHHACEEGILFVQRNKLEGFPISRLDEISGDYNRFVYWLENLPVCEYDDNGNVTIATYKSIKAKYFYDDNNNTIKKEIIPLYRSVEPYEYIYEYDSQNRLIKGISSNCVSHYKYDCRNNVIQFVYDNDDPINYKYDSQDRLIKEIAPQGPTVEYFYDDHSNITKITVSGTKFAAWDYEYSPDGHLLQAGDMILPDKWWQP